MAYLNLAFAAAFAFAVYMAVRRPNTPSGSELAAAKRLWRLAALAIGLVLAISAATQLILSFSSA